MKDRITFRPGSLCEALLKWCKANNATPSEAIRRALSAFLQVDAPAMTIGRPSQEPPVGLSDSPTA
jgi:hypothetical protein